MNKHERSNRHAEGQELGCAISILASLLGFICGIVSCTYKFDSHNIHFGTPFIFALIGGILGFIIGYISGFKRD